MGAQSVLMRSSGLVPCLLLLLLGRPAAWALLFENASPEEAKGLNVLWVRDCGNKPGDTCEEWQTQFSVGDSAKLENWLSRRPGGKPYDEVWLHSGGGVLNEGVYIARVLRRHRMTVRVRAGTMCVSSCTVAFMGGLFRYVEAGATYQVHSASKFMRGFGCGSKPSCFQKEFFDEFRQNPEAKLAEFASEEYVGARLSARRLLALFQRTLLLPLGQENTVSEDDDRFLLWARNHSAPPYRAAAADARRFRSEGEAAAQDIIMRIEREAMNAAIADLRANIASYGRRAEPALRMIEAMYMTSIIETAVLSPETLLRMGYVTKDFEAK